MYILKEIEAKQADQITLRVVNQIEDYERAIDLTENALNEEISSEQLGEGLATLDLDINRVVIVVKETIPKQVEELIAVLGEYESQEDLKKIFEEQLSEVFYLGLRVGGYFEKNAKTNIDNFKLKKDKAGNIFYQWDEL